MKAEKPSGFRRRPRRMAAARLALLLAACLLPVQAGFAAADGAARLGETAGLPDAAREEAYGRLRFQPAALTKGLVLSRRPFAVVADVVRDGAAGGEEAAVDGAVAVVAVWTGLLGRADRDLVAVWDEIRVDAAGRPVSVRLAEPRLLPDYFAADHQRLFRGAGHLGLYPWVSVPTDREAAEEGLAPVADGGVVDLYGHEFGDAPVNVQDAGPVRPLAAIPDRIVPRRALPAREIAAVPPDAAGHWAELFVLRLMRMGIVDGYADGTIRPERTLTRAEFVKLVLAVLQLPPSGSPSGYPDAAGHWAEPVLAAAEAGGLIPAGDGAHPFRPDDPIRRGEMAAVLGGALAALHLDAAERSGRFPDADGLAAEVREAVERAAGLGLVSGFPDGTFRPEEPLTRAQGFAVIAKLAEWR